VKIQKVAVNNLQGMPSDLFFFMEKRIKEIMLTTGVKMDRMIDVLHMWIIILIAIIRLWVKVQTQGLYNLLCNEKSFHFFLRFDLYTSLHRYRTKRVRRMYDVRYEIKVRSACFFIYFMLLKCKGSEKISCGDQLLHLRLWCFSAVMYN